MYPINKAINLYGPKRELNITQLYIYCIQNATLLRWFLMEIIRKELSEKNLKAIANLIIDSKNYILLQMQIINTFIHSVRITTILFVRTLFGNVSLN